MGKHNWAKLIADACFLCELLFGCYPDKDLSWGQWIVATSASKKARAERDAAMAALVALAPKKTDLAAEEVSGMKFVGYYIKDKFNLYSPDSFASKKPFDMEQAGVVANITLPDPYSSVPKDWYMVRKDEPLECVQVCFAGTELKTDLMPHFVRANQGVAQYAKTSASEIEARGMTAYKQRQILSESELDAKLAEKQIEIDARDEIKKREDQARKDRQGGDDGLEDIKDDDDDSDSPPASSGKHSALPEFLRPTTSTKPAAKKHLSTPKGSRNRGKAVHAAQRSPTTPTPILRASANGAPKVKVEKKPGMSKEDLAARDNNDKATNAFLEKSEKLIHERLDAGLPKEAENARKARGEKDFFNFYNGAYGKVDKTIINKASSIVK